MHLEVVWEGSENIRSFWNADRILFHRQVMLEIKKARVLSEDDSMLYARMTRLALTVGNRLKAGCLKAA